MPSGDLNSLPRASDLPGCCKQMVILSTPLFWLLRDHVLSPHSTPTTPTLLPPVAMQLSQLFLEYAQHTQPGVAKWLSHPPLEYTHHAPLPLCQLSLPHVSLENAHHARPSASCGYVASHQSLEYAHHAQPGVAMWLSHPSLEYAHHAHLSASCGYVAISFIPGVRTPRPARCGYLAISPIPGVRPPRPPLCQLWLRGYLVYPWSTHTTPGQVWLCGYLTRPWSTPTTPTSLPAVATWLSRPSLEYAHHAHLSASASCGDVTISLIPGVRTQRPARCGYVAISPIPEVRPPCPPLRLCQLWLSHLFPDHAHHAHPSVSCGYVASHQSLRTPRPARCGYVAISPVPGVRPPRPPLCQLWLRGYLAHPWSTPTTPTSLPLPAVSTWLSHLSLEYAHNAQPGVAMWLSHPSLKYAHHAHLSASASCGYLTYSRIMPTTPTLLPAVATWLLINPYAHHAQPGVAMWLSHPSLEYAHHAHLSASCGYVAISPIPGVRPPRPPLCLCQLWLRDYLTYPWSTHTTPSQVWLCGYLTHPRSTPTMPTSLPLPAVALSLIPGSCPPRPPFCQLWLRGFSSIPGVRTPRPARCAYLTCPWSTPTTPTLCQLWLRGYLTYPWSIPTTPALLPAVAMPPIPGVRPTHLAICQVWLCGYLPYPLSTPAAPTLCQRRLRSYLIYPWSTPILLPAAATRLRTWPWDTPTTPSQPPVWWLCGHLTFHQVGFSG